MPLFRVLCSETLYFEIEVEAENEEQAEERVDEFDDRTLPRWATDSEHFEVHEVTPVEPDPCD